MTNTQPTEMINGQDAIKMVLEYDMTTLEQARSFEYVYMATNGNKPLWEIAEGLVHGFDMMKDYIEDVEEREKIETQMNYTIDKINKCIRILEASK